MCAFKLTNVFLTVSSTREKQFIVYHLYQQSADSASTAHDFAHEYLAITAGAWNDY